MTHAYCVNLLRRADRRVEALLEFRKYGLEKEVMFFPATEGSTLKREATGAMYFTDGMKGCWDSHKRLFELALMHDWDNLLVFEDDLHFIPGFDYYFHLAMAHVPEDWEFLWIGFFLHNHFYSEKNVKEYLEAHEHNGYWMKPSNGWGTQCYCVRGRAIELIYKRLDKMTAQIDGQLLQIMNEEGIAHYAHFPIIVGQNGSQTDVQRPINNSSLD